jgi:hypothetical protein
VSEYLYVEKPFLDRYLRIDDGVNEDCSLCPAFSSSRIDHSAQTESAVRISRRTEESTDTRPSVGPRESQYLADVPYTLGADLAFKRQAHRLATGRG